VIEQLSYASPRPPRRSESAVVAVWSASIGVPPILLLILLHLLDIRVPRGVEPFVPTMLLLALAAMGVGLVSAVQSIAQREPRWRLAMVAGGACAGTLAWVAFGVVSG
jgi:hypothetical protein